MLKARNVNNTGLGNETGKFQNIKKKSTHEFFICLLVINENHMNSRFVLCQFENLCFENNALKMASVSTHAIADLKQRIEDEVAAMPVEMQREVMNSFRSQLEECVH